MIGTTSQGRKLNCGPRNRWTVRATAALHGVKHSSPSFAQAERVPSRRTYASAELMLLQEQASVSTGVLGWADWVYCRCFLSFVFLGVARRLELSPCNTSPRGCAAMLVCTITSELWLDVTFVSSGAHLERLPGNGTDQLLADGTRSRDSVRAVKNPRQRIHGAAVDDEV